MKNILKYILSFAFCVGVIFATTTTVNAEDNTIVCQEYSVGDELVFFYEFYYFAGQDGVNNGTKTRVDFRHIVDSEEPILCMYVENNYLRWFGLDRIEYEYNCYMWSPDNPQWINLNSGHVYNYHPAPYGNNQCVTIDFHTNIPIFSCKSDAEQYLNGNLDLKSAINYKKSMENNEWVKPFEDIEINDSDILVPDLSNISHEGFTVTNCNNDKYLIEIYMKSGFASPESGLSSLTTIDDALFVNNFGLITDNSEAYWNGPTINIAQLYGVDNISALTNSYTNFYTSYPSAKSYGIDASRDDTYKIWGNPFNKNTWFYTNNTEVNNSDLIGKSPYDFDLCFTNYRVRYFYYDDDSGYHYGPWCDVVYFSNGYITQSAIFQSNVGNIIETPITSGTQDSSGNINFNTSNIIDLNNPNELFSYLRSTINNINATGNTFMTLFATLFSFIPIELQIALWLGIACMIFIGVIKSI